MLDEANERGDPNSAFYRDVAHMLKRYAAGVAELLTDASSAPETSVAQPLRRGNAATPRDAIKREAIELRQREDALRAARACDRYRALLTTEHDRWVKGREELAEIQIEARRQDFEAVRRNFSEQAFTRLQAAVQSRVAAHMEALTPANRRTTESAAGAKALDGAKKEWNDEMCRTAMKDLRQEWRIAQKRLLNSLAREMRQERQVAADALEKHAQAWRQLFSTATGAWDAELQKAQEQLDRLAEGFAKALQVLLEAERSEARKHLSDQSEYFKAEIQEALRIERGEQARIGLQVRKMRIALLKWQQDYTRDAKRKAERAAQQQRFQALGICNPWDEPSDGQDEDEGHDQLDEEAVNEAMRVTESALSRMRAEDQAHAAPGMLKGTVRRLKGKEAAENLALASQVVDQIHRELPVDGREVRDFLLRVEQAAPACSEVIRVYEEHLAEHGILAPLCAIRKPGAADDSDDQGVAAEVGAMFSEPPASPMSPSPSSHSGRQRMGRVRSRNAVAAHHARAAPRSPRTFR
mmetsp:Transcript_134085/g.388111  ORF Transcript_134085/g.388111 Transcript_134085/m.388111 type:complete len:525 (-) Transcript_134085:55-1629(-)